MTGRHSTPRTLGMALLLVIITACSQTPTQSRAPTSSSKSASADIHLADALRLQSGQLDFARATALVKSAYDKAPDRADIAWLYAQLCGAQSECQAQAAESRMRRLDPGNGAAWLGALGRAQRSRDSATENEILEAMSRSDRFDIYWNSLVSSVAVVMGVDTASQLGPTTPDLVSTSLNEAIGSMSAIALPAFRPLNEACAGTRLNNPATAQRCQAIAETLVRGDTHIAEGVGLGIKERIAAPASPQAQQVAADIRRSRYQLDVAGQIIASQVDREKFSRELIKLMSNLRREQDVYLAVIRWAGQPVEPPPQYQ